jgi:hypothetical protein
MTDPRYGSDQLGASEAGVATSVAIRASDADREQAAEALRQHFAQGRLDTEELETRLRCCYGATTVDELRAMAADLPGGTACRPADGPAWLDLRPLPPPALIVPCLVAVVALASVTGGQALWLAWPLAFLLLRRRRWCRQGAAPTARRHSTRRRRRALPLGNAL